MEIEYNFVCLCSCEPSLLVCEGEKTLVMFNFNVKCTFALL